MSEPLVTVTPTLPYEPPGLKDIINSISYKPGWQFYLGLFREEDPTTPDEEPVIRGWAFYVISDSVDSLDFSSPMRVRHEFLIPPASYNSQTWKVWLKDRIGDVEMHERNEFLRFDGLREFAPHHGRGEDPYITWHISDYQTANKSSGDD